MSVPVPRSPSFGESALLHLQWMAQARGVGVVGTVDQNMLPTSLCVDPHCGHVRWRHGPYPNNPCKVPGCPCVQGWSFVIAAYDGNRDSGKKPDGTTG